MMSWTGAFSFLFAGRARDQARHLLAKSLKEQTKTCPGQAQLKSFLSRGKFFEALAKGKLFLVPHGSCM